MVETGEYSKLFHNLPYWGVSVDDVKIIEDFYRIIRYGKDLQETGNNGLPVVFNFIYNYVSVYLIGHSTKEFMLT